MATESKELRALRAYLDASGVPHRVTASLGRYVSAGSPCYPHATGSYHCRPGTDGPGLALDLAGPTPGRNSPQLLAIFAAFGPVESRLAELIYSGAPYSIRHGKRVPLYAIAAHYDHVHVSVPFGTFLPAPKPIEVKPMWDPPLSVCAVLSAPGGGVWGLGPDGGVYAFAGAPFYGSAAGQAYFTGRKAALLEAHPSGGYVIVATSGERYNYPAP